MSKAGTPPKVDGISQMTGAQHTPFLQQVESVITDAGGTLIESDSLQFRQALNSYASIANFYIDTGTATEYVLNPQGAFKAPIDASTTWNGMLIRFRPTNNNTGVATLRLAGLNGGLPFNTLREDGATIQAGDFLTTRDAILRYNSTAGAFMLLTVPVRNASQTVAGISYINKQITIANNVTDANNDIDFTSGTFTFSDYTGMASVGAMTKRLDASWTAGTNNGGLDTGSKANSTWYHSYAIYNPTSGVSDFIFSTNATTPTLPSGYTKYKLIESIYVLSSGAIMSFKDMGDRIVFSPVTELSTGSGTILNTLTIRSPLGRNIKNIIYAGCQISSASGYSGVKLFSGDGLEMGEARGYGITTGGGNLGAFGDAIVQTNLLSQIKYQGYGLLASITIYNYGWLKDLNL